MRVVNTERIPTKPWLEDIEDGALAQAKNLANEVLAHPRLSKTPSCEVATYQAGYAQFGLRDYREAGRTLSKLAPFEQDFGPHARFLLARAHQLADERPEALGQFQAVLDGYEKRKAQAVEAIKQQNLPAGRRAALTALAQGPAGDYVIRAQFHLAQLTAEMGKYAEAAQAFGAFAQKYANNPLVPEAQLRLAWCQIQQRSFNEAIGLLGNLAKNPDLADQAKLFTLLSPEPAIGVTLTSAYQLVPEASTSAIVVHHPAAMYYLVKV